MFQQSSEKTEESNYGIGNKKELFSIVLSDCGGMYV